MSLKMIFWDLNGAGVVPYSPPFDPPKGVTMVKGNECDSE